MSTIPVSVDPEAINKYIADQILESALGDRLHETVATALKALTGFGNDPLKTAVISEINKQITDLVAKEYAEMIRNSVREKLTDEFIDNLVNGFINSITVRMDYRG